jgi:hypothetical protein
MLIARFESANLERVPGATRAVPIMGKSTNPDTRDAVLVSRRICSRTLDRLSIKLLYSRIPKYGTQVLYAAHGHLGLSGRPVDGSIQLSRRVVADE